MSVTIHTGHAIDVLRGMEAGSVQMVCTSPPYFAARKYGTDPVTWGGDPTCDHSWREEWTNNNNTGGGVTWKQVSNPGSYQQGGPVQRKEPGKRGYSTHTCERCGAVQADLGREALHDCHAWARGEAPCPACYVCHIRSIFAEVYRVLRADGVLFLNLDDSMSGTGGGQKDTGKAAYNAETFRDAEALSVPGLPDGNLCGVPWRTALALQADGWILRSATTLVKSNPMTESMQGMRWASCRVKVKPQEKVTGDGKQAGHGALYAGFNERWNGKAEPAKYAPCPGCKRCRDHGGYRLFNGSGRPTEATEMLFIFVKGKGYFWNTEAVRREKAAYDRKGGKAPYTADGSGTNGIGSDSLHKMSGRGGNALNHLAWVPAPSELKHYAMFPPFLPEFCVKAATPEHSCSACGVPYAPVVEKGEPDREWQKACGGDAAGGYDGKATKDYAEAGAQNGADTKRSILKSMVRRTVSDWWPTCGHDAPPRPAVVLDPFSGAGTTVMVADRFGRHGIGIELNPDYARLSEARLRRDAGLFAEVLIEASEEPAAQEFLPL